jgi:hypothetical protein
MRPAAGTRLFFIGTEGVLFSEPRQELHAFNTMACVIWCHLEDGLTPSRIAEKLAAPDEATAHAHVDAALADWTARGLLADASPVPLASPPATSVLDLPPAADEFAAVRSYRILGVTVRIRFGREGDARLVVPLFAHRTFTGPGTPDVVVDISRVAGGIGFYIDSVPAGFCRLDDEIAPMAKGVVWTEVLKRQDYLIHVHAGVAGGPAGCVLLPAAPGSGKSTLTAALVHAGFDLFSDEVALLAAEDLTVSPFPAAICVKDTGVEVVARMYPAIRELPIHLRGDGKHVAYLPPPSGQVPSDGHRRRVCGIVFPRYSAGSEVTSRQLAPAAALARLLAHCQNVGRKLDHAAIDRLIRWIDAMPCSEIVYGALEPACDMIGAMLRGDGVASGDSRTTAGRH